MCLIKFLKFFKLVTLIIIFSLSCSKSNEKIYILPFKDSQKQVVMICKQTDASHFTVRNSRLWLRKKDGKEIELKYNKFLLQDGYYFCTEQARKSDILD